MTPRYILLTLLLIGGVLVTDIAWAALPTEIQIFHAQCHQGNAEGCLQLGIRYDFGLGVTQDYVQAVDLTIGYRCVGHGNLAARQARSRVASFGSRQPLHKRAVPTAPGGPGRGL